MPEVFFNGPAGRIEGRFYQNSDKKAPTSLILHPHPMFGGTMNTKVVHSAYRSLAQNGFSVLRINFRGVGRSQGQYDNGIGELTDAATALDWLQANYPYTNNYLVAGFSFGAWIALQLIMRRPEINQFIAISPPVNKYDFSFLSPCPVPGLIIQGSADSIVPEENVAELANKLSKQKQSRVEYQMVSGADHFFRGKEEELITTISEFIQNRSFNNDSISSNSRYAIKLKQSQKIFLN